MSSIERGPQQEPENKDPVISAINDRLNNLREFGGKIGEIEIPRLQNVLGEINKGNKDAYDTMAKELGLKNHFEDGEIKLDSKGVLPQKISESEHKRIEESLNR